ncbi:MAG: S8 family serine peptidase [Planctomycetota bacterium]|jgi:hypothetical protein
MMRKCLFIILLVTLPFVSAISAKNPMKFPKIDRKPEPASWNKGKVKSLAKYNPDASNPFQVDLRTCDLSSLDLRNSLDNLQYADFDDRTVWPCSDHIPKHFDWKHIMELGKNPGLGVRELHKQGITGSGIGIAIIDNPLLVEHQEYANQLQLYEEINIKEMKKAENGHGMDAHMHGTAVVSIAVGKTLGVAPKANVYYVATWPYDWDEKGVGIISSLKYRAQAIFRILEINEQLPKDKKICVISMSIGWSPSTEGYREISKAAQKAKDAGMLVICSSTDRFYGFKFHGLGRPPLANPDIFESYEPGLFWAKSFYTGVRKIGSKHLLVPMDSRTAASPTGSDEYVFYRSGGWSWSIPYIAGVYALAAQVEPAITPERFWMLAMKTGRTIELENDGKKILFGQILDPVKLIDAFRTGDLSDSKAIEAELRKYKTGDNLTLTELKFLQNINTRVVQIDINKATVDDIIEVFGKPLAYQLGRQFFEKHELPDKYIIKYPTNFSIFMVNGHIEELRFHKPGYKFRNKLQIGATLEETFEFLGPPLETVQGRPKKFKDGVLYKDIDKIKGYCYYCNVDQNIRLFFEEYKVNALFVTRGGS